MPETAQRLRAVPDGYARFLHNKALAHPKHQPYLPPRVRELTGRSWGVSAAHRLHKLRQYVRGWMNYFGISEYYRPLAGLDRWLRRRVRMCYWKMWKRPRKRMAELMKLGGHPQVGICTGRSPVASSASMIPSVLRAILLMGMCFRPAWQVI